MTMTMTMTMTIDQSINPSIHHSSIHHPSILVLATLAFPRVRSLCVCVCVCVCVCGRMFVAVMSLCLPYTSVIQDAIPLDSIAQPWPIHGPSIAYPWTIH